MSSPLQIGITGNMGSGKSTVCKIFNALGIPTYDADNRAKWVMVNDQQLVAALIEEFGNEAYDENGNLNRPYISSQVFNNSERLNKLNALVHPRVKQDYERWVATNSNYRYVIKEAALLFESGSYKQLDKLVVITAPEHIRIARVQQRDPQRTVEEIKNILAKQMPESEKKKKADYIIKNDESLLLTEQVLQLHAELLQLSSSRKNG